MTAGIASTAFLLLMIVAGVSDVLSRRIPNLLILVVIVSFFLFAHARGLALKDVGLHLVAGFVMLAIAYACFAARLIGGGDAKLLAAVTVWFGLHGSAAFLMMAAISGGALAIVIGFWSFLKFEADIRDLAHRNRLAWIRPSLPYGFAIATGAMFAAPGTWWGPAVPFWSLLTAH